MKIKYKEPKEIMNDLLFQSFENNQYFKFSDFAQKVNSTQSHYPIDYDMMKDFIYEMIDDKKIMQEFVFDNQNNFLPVDTRANAKDKSVHFKIITAEQ